MNSIEVVFIRHAESEENVKLQYFCNTIQKIASFQIPSFYELLKCFKILECNLDSALTINGKRQLLDLKLILNEEKNSFGEYKHIVYSPLQRTKETCMSLIPSEQHHKCIPLDLIKEISPLNYLFPSYIKQRTTEFEQWLYKLKSKKIMIIGHCQYFSNLLQSKVYMRNCDVWKSTASFEVTDDKINCTWSEPLLLYRTNLSTPHPIYKLKSFFWKQSNDNHYENDIINEDQYILNNNLNDINHIKGLDKSMIQDSVVDDSDDHNNQPICRICQLTQSEAPDLRMIQPCLCSGSVSHVHINCLNIWRQTSTNAYYSCSICKYNYKLERTWYAQLCVNDMFVLFITTVMIIIICYTSGHCLVFLIEKLKFSIQPMEFICRLLSFDLHLLHRQCSRRPLLLDNIKAIYTSHKHDFKILISIYFQLLRSNVFKLAIICHPFIYDLCSIFLIGCLAIGSLVFISYLFHLIFDQFRLFNNLFGNHNLLLGGNIILLLAWFFSLGSIARNRLCLVIGILIAIRELYYKLIIFARKCSHYIGDSILEPIR